MLSPLANTCKLFVETMVASFRTICFAMFILPFVMNFAIAQDGSERERVMLILDGSGSMWGRIDEEPKISIAKEVMGELVGGWRDQMDLGLMSYGHRRKDDCSDIEVLADVGQASAADLMAQVRSINPKGKTPITDAVRKAAARMLYSAQKTTIVVVSDGLETCEGDPCALASILDRTGIDFTIHVVGFDVTEEERKGLQCMADQTGGRYFQAGDTEQLRDALNTARKVIVESSSASGQSADIDGNDTDLSGNEGNPNASQEPPQTGTLLQAKACQPCANFDPSETHWTIDWIGEDGKAEPKRVFNGLASIASYGLELEPGRYRARVRLGSTSIVRETTLFIFEDKLSRRSVNLNVGRLKVSSIASDEETGELVAADPILYRFFHAAKGELGHEPIALAAVNDQLTWVPAGTNRITAFHKQNQRSLDVVVRAGDTHEHVLDFRVGYIEPSAIAKAGGKADQVVYGYKYQLYPSREDFENNRKQLRFGLGDARFAVDPGKYHLVARAGDAVRGMDVVVVAAKTIEPVVILNAGFLDYSFAPRPGQGSVFLRVFAFDEEDGLKRKAAISASAKKRFYLNEGTYVVQANQGGKQYLSEPVKVIAGEKTVLEMR